MGKTKLTLRVEKSLIDATKQYAREHGTTVSQLVSNFMYALNKKIDPPSNTPILDKLTGILPSDTTIADYKEYLDKKYGV